MSAETHSHRTPFRVLGIPFIANSQSWQFVMPKLVIGIIVAVLAKTGSSLLERVGWGVIYGLLLVILLFLHIIGHVLASKMVSPPMTEARITPVLIQTLYSDDANTSSRVHLIRSLGGPIITSLSLIAWNVIHHHLLLYFALANFAILLMALPPFPTVDGEVIWREVGQWMKNQMQR